MPRRVNPIILLGLIIASILTAVTFASATGGSPGDAVAIATAQVGKPYVFGTDGPDTFSCAGLMRYALRLAGVDDNAPWGHQEYLGVYPNDPTPQVGDVVVYADGVAMYIGGDTVVMANAVDGVVGTYPMYSIGTPLGFANPYGGAADPVMQNDPATPVDQTATAPISAGPLTQYATDPAPSDTLLTDSVLTDPTLTDPVLGDPVLGDTIPNGATQYLTDPGQAAPVPADPVVPANLPANDATQPVPTNPTPAADPVNPTI